MGWRTRTRLSRKFGRGLKKTRQELAVLMELGSAIAEPHLLNLLLDFDAKMQEATWWTSSRAPKELNPSLSWAAHFVSEAVFSAVHIQSFLAAKATSRITVAEERAKLKEDMGKILGEADAAKSVSDQEMVEFWEEEMNKKENE